MTMAKRSASLRQRTEAPTRKRHMAVSRTVVLGQLRQERDHLQRARILNIGERNAPLLYRLALAAECRPRRSRHVLFEGIRFPVEFGWYDYVRDPDFPWQTLVAVNGL